MSCSLHKAMTRFLNEVKDATKDEMLDARSFLKEAKEDLSKPVGACLLAADLIPFLTKQIRRY